LRHGGVSGVGRSGGPERVLATLSGSSASRGFPFSVNRVTAAELVGGDAPCPRDCRTAWTRRSKVTTPDSQSPPSRAELTLPRRPARGCLRSATPTKGMAQGLEVRNQHQATCHRLNAQTSILHPLTLHGEHKVLCIHSNDISNCASADSNGSRTRPPSSRPRASGFGPPICSQFEPSAQYLIPGPNHAQIDSSPDPHSSSPTFVHPLAGHDRPRRSGWSGNGLAWICGPRWAGAWRMVGEPARRSA
jgi:hypothetical protein